MRNIYILMMTEGRKKIKFFFLPFVIVIVILANISFAEAQNTELIYETEIPISFGQQLGEENPSNSLVTFDYVFSPPAIRLKGKEFAKSEFLDLFLVGTKVKDYERHKEIVMDALGLDIPKRLGLIINGSGLTVQRYKLNEAAEQAWFRPIFDNKKDEYQIGFKIYKTSEEVFGETNVSFRESAQRSASCISGTKMLINLEVTSLKNKTQPKLNEEISAAIGTKYIQDTRDFFGSITSHFSKTFQPTKKGLTALKSFKETCKKLHGKK